MLSTWSVISSRITIEAVKDKKSRCLTVRYVDGERARGSFIHSYMINVCVCHANCDDVVVEETEPSYTT